MAITKTDLFTDELRKMAELFKAMGHPARLSILKLLSRRDTCVCGDITDELPLAQSTVSQHLKALKNAGLIQGEIDGVRTCYCLSDSGLQLLQSLSIPFIEELNDKNEQNCC